MFGQDGQSRTDKVYGVVFCSKCVLMKREMQRILSKEEVFSAGIHLIADFWFGQIINNRKALRALLLKAAKAAQNTPLEVSICLFSPRGITGVVLLAESHIAIHTWPEIGYTAIDIFTCGTKTQPRKALNFLKKSLHPKKLKIHEMKRGTIYEKCFGKNLW